MFQACAPALLEPYLSSAPERGNIVVFPTNFLFENQKIFLITSHPEELQPSAKSTTVAIAVKQSYRTAELAEVTTLLFRIDIEDNLRMSSSILSTRLKYIGKNLSLFQSRTLEDTTEAVSVYITMASQSANMALSPRQSLNGQRMLRIPGKKTMNNEQ